jgi:Domain of unknown function (DUF4160)
MPEVSRFYGIIIRMYFDEHPPPHFHAEYSEDEVLININTLAVISGKLPSRALGLVVEWAFLHQAELGLLWERARNMESLGKIEPLK